MVPKKTLLLLLYIFHILSFAHNASGINSSYVKTKLTTWYNHLTHSYDYKALALSGCCFAAAIGLGYHIWRLTGKKYDFYDKQFNEKVAQLNAVGITVTEERWGNHHEIIIHRSSNESLETQNLRKKITKELVNIRDEYYNDKAPYSINDYVMMVEILGVPILCKVGWHFLMQGLYPNYK